MRMGLRYQSEKSSSGLLPTHHHQHSDGSEAEECVGGGFGDYLAHTELSSGIAELVGEVIGVRGAPDAPGIREVQAACRHAGEITSLRGPTRHVEEGEGIPCGRSVGGDVEDEIATVGEHGADEVD